MKTVELLRVDKSIEGVFGVLKIEGRVFCVTLERPWADNLPSVSCIPDGEYIATQHMSPRFGLTYQLQSVPGRSDILLHWGNTIGDSEGCIILGRYYGWVSSRNARGVLSSKATFTNFMNIMRREPEFTLVIRSA